MERDKSTRVGGGKLIMRLTACVSANAGHYSADGGAFREYLNWTLGIRSAAG
jgi:hypothetical protein